MIRSLWIVAICLATGCRTMDSLPEGQPSRADFTPVDTHARSPTHIGNAGKERALPNGVQAASYVQEPRVEADPIELPVPPDEIRHSLALDRLEQLALMHNPSLAEARAHVDAMQGEWIQVGLPPNTEMGYSGQQLFSGGLAEQQGVYVQQTVVLGHKLRLNRAVAAQEIQRVESLYAAQEQRVLTDVRLAYYDILVAQRRSQIAQQLDQIAVTALETTESLLQADEVSRVDVMRSQVERQNADLLLQQANTLLQAAWSTMVAVVGVADISSWGDLEGSVDPTLDEIRAADVLARIVSESPEMAAALSRVERTRWAVERAFAEPVPDVDFQAVFQGDRGTHSSNANFQVTIPIPWLNRNQGGIQQAWAELAEAQRAVDRLRLSFEQRLAPLYQSYAFARSQVEAYTREGGILEKSARTLELVGQGYAGGELSYLDLVTAQQTNARTNLAYVDALKQYWSALIEMEGLLLKGSLNTEVHAE
jgi:cobalt-zinc-cadmium efflux system outer membrane protein